MCARHNLTEMCNANGSHHINIGANCVQYCGCRLRPRNSEGGSCHRYEASGKIGIKLSGSVGASDATAPSAFKVEDGLIFNAVKPGDKVSFTSERVGDEMIIKKLTKD